MKGKTFMQQCHYFSIVQNGHGAELTAGDVDHHFVLQAAADPTGRRLVGCRPRTHLARIVVAPCKHLNAARNTEFDHSDERTRPAVASVDSRRRLTSPSAVSAMVWWEPQATSVTFLLRRLVDTRAGVSP